MAESFGEKSQDATPYRRQKAREDGNVAKSQDLASAALLLGTLMVLMYLGTAVVTYLGHLAVRQFGTAPQLQVDQAWAVTEWHTIVGGLGTVLLPIFGLILLLAIAVHIGQVGFLFLPKQIGLDFSRISLMKGVKRIFSIASTVRLGFGIIKIMVVAGVAFWCLWSQREAIFALSSFDVYQIANFIATITLGTCLKIAGVLFILAIFDFAYQRWKHSQDLKMTQQEIREETKMLQGDPQIAARRRAIQRQLSLSRLSGVPQADVVVTNPTHLAIAIRYDPEKMVAPVVVAKGAGTIAERIRRIAAENDVPIVERKPLARTLYQIVEVNHPVPVEQYAAVAEVLRYVYELKGKKLPPMKQAS